LAREQDYLRLVQSEWTAPKRDHESTLRKHAVEKTTSIQGNLVNGGITAKSL